MQHEMVLIPCLLNRVLCRYDVASNPVWETQFQKSQTHTRPNLLCVGLRMSTYKASATGVDALILKVAAKIASVDLDIADSEKTTLQVQHPSHPFYGNPAEDVTGTSLPGCIRLLIPGSGAQYAATESWIQSVDQTLLPIIRQSTSRA